MFIYVVFLLFIKLINWGFICLYMNNVYERHSSHTHARTHAHLLCLTEMIGCCSAHTQIALEPSSNELRALPYHVGIHFIIILPNEWKLICLISLEKLWHASKCVHSNTCSPRAYVNTCKYRWIWASQWGEKRQFANQYLLTQMNQRKCFGFFTFSLFRAEEHTSRVSTAHIRHER